MIKPDQLKAMIEAWEPEGFEVIQHPNCKHYKIPFHEDTKESEEVQYCLKGDIRSLLLTRLIEAVNRKFRASRCDYFIIVDVSGLEVRDDYGDLEKRFEYADIPTIDEAKEAVLLYVAEKEGII